MSLHRRFQQSIVGLECVASRWNVWVSLVIDEIPRRGAKVDEKAPYQTLSLSPQNLASEVHGDAKRPARDAKNKTMVF